MNQQPDNFFREKLRDFTKPAPSGAWEQIESSLEKKNKFGWIKIAASLLLVATCAYLLLLNKDEEQKALVHSKNKIQPAVTESHNKKNMDNQLALEENVKRLSGSSQQATKAKSNKKIEARKIKTTLAPEISANVSEPSEKDAPIYETTPLANPETDIDQNLETLPTPRTITLKYTVEETNKYLDKNAVAQATSDEKKSSTFTKLLKKANDLKSNQNPFGDLREKKNEILALNFKNETGGQNK